MQGCVQLTYNRSNPFLGPTVAGSWYHQLPVIVFILREWSINMAANVWYGIVLQICNNVCKCRSIDLETRKWNMVPGGSHKSKRWEGMINNLSVMTDDSVPGCALCKTNNRNYWNPIFCLSFQLKFPVLSIQYNHVLSRYSAFEVGHYVPLSKINNTGIFNILSRLEYNIRFNVLIPIICFLWILSFNLTWRSSGAFSCI